MQKYIYTILILLLPMSVFAGDINLGKEKSAMCVSCHGVEGISMVPIYPNLKGQKEAYIVGALKAYKSGDRKAGMAAIMAGQAMALTAQDIDNLAAYYSSLK